MITMVRTIVSPADQHWGFEFGVDGLVSKHDASVMLGKISIDTLDRLCESGKLRKGKFPDGKRVGICRRSLMTFIRSMEL